MNGAKTEQAANSGNETSSMPPSGRAIAAAALTPEAVATGNFIPKDQVEWQRSHVLKAVNTVATKEGFDARPFTDQIYSAVRNSLYAEDGAKGYKTILTVTGDRGRQHQLFVFVPTAEATRNGEKVTVYEVKKGTHTTETKNHVL